jgi:hypothetical protein
VQRSSPCTADYAAQQHADGLCRAATATVAHLMATSKGLRVAARNSLLNKPQNCLAAPVGYVQLAGCMASREPVAQGGV